MATTEKTDEAVVSRLRASKERCDKERKLSGFEVGQGWARELAEAEELERLESFIDGLQPCDPEFFDDDDNSAYSTAESLYFQISPEYDGDREAAADFWEGVVGAPEKAPHAKWVEGFADGALDVWREVKSQL